MSQDRVHRAVREWTVSAWARVGIACWAVVVLLVVVGGGRWSLAQTTGEEAFLAPDDSPPQYILTMSGTVGSESFRGVRALLTISFTPPGSQNLYKVFVVGFPTANTRNCFNFDSDEGRLETQGTTITCQVKLRNRPISGNHFFYMSPVLYSRQGSPTQSEAERTKHIDATAEPTKILALTGTLHLDVSKERLKGRVTMTGLDPRGHDYVQYNATFVGQRTTVQAPRPVP